jgi:hypothetical protein
MPEEPGKLDETLDAKPYEPSKGGRSLVGLYACLGVMVAMVGFGVWLWTATKEPNPANANPSGSSPSSAKPITPDVSSSPASAPESVTGKASHLVWERGERPTPIVLQGRGREMVRLVYYAGKEIRLKESSDSGRSWSDAVSLGQGRILDVCGDSLLRTVADGSLAIHSIVKQDGAPKEPQPVRMTFASGQRPWADSAPIADSSDIFQRGTLLIEGQTIYVAAGVNRPSSPICVTWSTDGGSTWAEVASIQVADNANWGCRLIHLDRQGKTLHLLFQRYCGGVGLMHFCSEDGGRTWNSADAPAQNEEAHRWGYTFLRLPGSYLAVCLESRKRGTGPWGFTSYLADRLEQKTWQCETRLFDFEAGYNSSGSAESRVAPISAASAVVLAYPCLVGLTTSEVTTAQGHALRTAAAASPDGGISWQMLAIPETIRGQVTGACFGLKADGSEVMGIITAVAPSTGKWDSPTDVYYCTWPLESLKMRPLNEIQARHVGTGTDGKTTYLAVYDEPRVVP